MAATNLASLAAKPVSPHTLRHTTALHLLQSGVEPNVIKSWLSPPIVVRRQARGWRPRRPDGALLADLWDELVLPRAVRSVWAPLVAPSGGAT